MAFARPMSDLQVMTHLHSLHFANPCHTSMHSIKGDHQRAFNRLFGIISKMQKACCYACLGRILNRFSSDTATADDSLPFTLNILLANLFGLLGSVVMLCISEPWLLLVLFPLAIVYKYLQTYYRDTARELRRLNSIAR